MSRPSSSGGRCDRNIWTEAFNDGMRAVLRTVGTPHAVDLDGMPPFNGSEGHGPKRAHPDSAYFDDLSRHLWGEIYHRDFRLFRYDLDAPDRREALGEIDLYEVHAKLGA